MLASQNGLNGVTCLNHACIKRTGYTVGRGTEFTPMKVALWCLLPYMLLYVVTTL